MADTRITRARIDQLLRFLPALGTPGPNTEPGWHQPTRDPGGCLVIHTSPSYPPAVAEFFTLASQEWWCDYQYDAERAAAVIADDAAVAAASLAAVKELLTYCVRGERFCGGHWGAMLAAGRVGAILRRLRVLRDQAADGR